MTNTEEQNEIILQNEASDTSQAGPIKPLSNGYNKFSYLLTCFALIIAMVATALSVYTIKLNHQLQKELEDETTQVATQITQLNQSQADNQDQLQQNNNHLENALDNLKNQVQTSLNQRQYQKDDWVLFKARYYLELAQINSYWSDDINTSAALLQQADDLLKQLAEPKIFDVRQAIANELTQIKAIPQIDTTGILTQLDAAQSNVDSLSIQTIKDKSELGLTATTTTDSNPANWRSRLQGSVGLLEKLVIIRRDNEDIKPLLSPLFVSSLKESIRLSLQEAQWAVISKNQVVYQMALKQATANIKRVFDETAKNTAELIKKLNELQQIKLTQEKPTMGQALPLLNQLIDTKALPVKPTTTNGQGEH